MALVARNRQRGVHRTPWRAGTCAAIQPLALDADSGSLPCDQYEVRLTSDLMFLSFLPAGS